MAEKIVTVGRYSDATAAHIALAQLQTAGIHATLTGDMPSSIFPGNALMTQYQLQVAESESKRALEILFDGEHEQLDPDWEMDIDKEGGWVCTLCGSSLDDSVETCPDCLTARGAVREKRPVRRPMLITATPKESTEPLQKEGPSSLAGTSAQESASPNQEIDAPDEDDLRADSVLAKRAMRAAIGSCFAIPMTLISSLLGIGAFFLLTFYSIYLLVKIARIDGKLTPRAERQVWWAVICTILPWAGFFLILLSIFRGW